MEVESECTIFTLACLETVTTDPDAITCNFIVSSDELLWLNLLHVDSTTSCVLTNICQAVGTKGLLMSITSHHGTHHPNNPEWIGSSYNLSIEWENGETIVDNFRATVSTGPNCMQPICPAFELFLWVSTNLNIHVWSFTCPSLQD
jgi:hypothetical protein